MDKKYYIIVSGKKHEVNREVYKAYQKFENKIKYSEKVKKADKVIIDEEMGRITIIKGKETSLEYLTVKNAGNFGMYSDAQDLIENKLMLDYALNRLHREDRKFIEMLYFQGYSMKELSMIFNIPISTLYYKLDKILCKLNEILSN